MKFSLFSFETSKRSAEDTSDLQSPRQWFIEAMGSPANSVSVNHSSSLTISAWWRGVNLISDLVSSLSFEIIEYQDQGRKVAYSHPQWKVVNRRASSFMTSQQFRKVMELIRLNRGNAYALIKRNEATGYATEFIVLNPDKVHPFIQKGKKYFRINGQSQLVDNSDMIHIMGPSLDGVKGLNMIQYHKATLELAMGTRNFQNKFYQNGGFFKGFLKVAGKLEKTTPKEVSQEFDSTWSGPDNTFKTPVLQQGTEYVPVSLPQKDAQTLETSKSSIEDVGRILGVPVHRLMSGDKTSYASQEQENLMFVQDNIRVRVKEWEAEFNQKILLDDSRFAARMNLESLLRADTRTRIEKYRVMFNAGAINPDEIREYEGMQPRGDEGGQKYFTPVNMISAQQLEKAENNTGDE